MNEESQPLLSSPSPTRLSATYPAYTNAGDVFSVRGTRRSKGITRCSFVLVLLTETLERTAFYGLICNMLMFLNSNPMGWMSYNASVVILMLNGLSYVTAVGGGWLADSFLGKFRTIVIFFCIYIAGYTMWPVLYPYPYAHSKDNNTNLTAPSWCVNPYQNNSSTESLRPVNQENCWWPVYISVIVIAIGYGAVRVNLIPFGADQVEHEGQHAMRTYFNWFYWCINIGSLFAYGILGYVQQEKTFFWGYVAPNIALLGALLAFVLGETTMFIISKMTDNFPAEGSQFYIKKPASGSPIGTAFRVCLEAVRTWNRRRKRDVELFVSDIASRPSSCLDYAKPLYGGSCHDSDVDEVKVLFKVLVVFITLVPYWVVYFQMQTTFIWQALHMQLDFESEDSKEAAQKRKFNIPAAWLSLFNVVFILLLLPLLDKVVYPLLDKYDYSPSLRARILIGMFFSMMSMAMAGCVEKIRWDTFWKNETYADVHWQFMGSTYYEAAHMSVLFQLPQYALIGIGELFTSIAGLELAYIYAPRSMQGIIMSLFWFSQGLGALVGVATMYGFVGKWFTSYDHGNINCSLDTKGQCHLNYYFYFVGGIQLFGMFAFGLASWSLNIGRTVPVRIQRRGITMVKPDRRDRDEEDETTTTPTTPPTQGYEDEDSVNRLRSRSDQSDGI